MSDTDQTDIPNASQAIVDIRKLRDYCLNPSHPTGKHKARLLVAAVGMTASDAEALQTILLEVIGTNKARLGRHDEYGQRYTIDFELEWRGQQAIVRSGWIIEHNTDIPKLTTCYPL